MPDQWFLEFFSFILIREYSQSNTFLISLHFLLFSVSVRLNVNKCHTLMCMALWNTRLTTFSTFIHRQFCITTYLTAFVTHQRWEQSRFTNLAFLFLDLSNIWRMKVFYNVTSSTSLRFCWNLTPLTRVKWRLWCGLHVYYLEVILYLTLLCCPFSFPTEVVGRNW